MGSGSEEVAGLDFVALAAAGSGSLELLGLGLEMVKDLVLVAAMVWDLVAMAAAASVAVGSV